MGPIQKFLTLIRKEPNSQNSAFSRKDYRNYLYYKFDLIFQPITPFVGLSSQCRSTKQTLSRKLSTPRGHRAGRAAGRRGGRAGRVRHRAQQTPGARHARTARTGAGSGPRPRTPPTPMGIGAPGSPGCRPAAQRTLHRPAPASAGPATPRARKARSRDPRRSPGAPARRPGMRAAPCPAPTAWARARAPDAGRAGSRRSAEDCRTKLAAVHAPPGGTRVSALTRRASCADGARRFEEARDRRRRQGAGEEARAAGELR